MDKGGVEPPLLESTLLGGSNQIVFITLLALVYPAFMKHLDRPARYIETKLVSLT